MALAQKGIDVRQTGTHLAFRALLQDSAGALVTGGTTSLYLYELQSDGTLKSYDFNDNTFKTTALTTETLGLTHRKGNNATTDTGLWTGILSTLSGFTVGGIYFARVKNTGASPADQVREFQYGSEQGDLVVTANGSGVGELNSDLRMILGTATTEGGAGRLAAAFTKLLDVAIPVFTAASINQTGDSFARLGAPAGASIAADIAANLTAINNLNNLSALANLFGPQVLEIPDSSITLYPFTLVIRDTEGHLIDLDSSPTVTATNAAGVDRSANLSAIAHGSTGVYTFTYSVSSAAAEEGLRIVATGAVGASARRADFNCAVVDYDSITLLNSINAKVQNLPPDPADASDIAASFVKIRRYLQLMARKDAAIATDNATELGELNADGGSGAGSFDNTTDSEQAIVDRGNAAWITGGGGGGGGSGARTITVTVNDGVNPLQNANVRFTLNADSFVLQTDASGQCTFNLDDGTWLVAISLAGYSFAGTTLAVAADASVAYSMTQVVITPSSPGFTTGYLTVYDETGVAESGVTITATVWDIADSLTGSSFDATPRTATSDAQGLVQFANLVKGVTYAFARGTAKPRYIEIPDSAGATYALPVVIGLP